MYCENKTKSTKYRVPSHQHLSDCDAIFDQEINFRVQGKCHGHQTFRIRKNKERHIFINIHWLVISTIDAKIVLTRVVLVQALNVT